MNILITGGAGFIGLQLALTLKSAGHHVVILDNFCTSEVIKNNQCVYWDVRNPIYPLPPKGLDQLDQIYHLACPASPTYYLQYQLFTLETAIIGTQNVLKLAEKCNARVLLASTSEVYGEAEMHPQTEEYYGNVNPIGPRSCYDEGKRVAETLASIYAKRVDVRIARIFNTYGPTMSKTDGRVIPEFISRALKNRPLIISGDGYQTRSFCYISDTVSALIALMNSDYGSPVNIGNPEEIVIRELAQLVIKLTNSKSGIDYFPALENDPRKRQPDITIAKDYLGWKPKVMLELGLEKVIEEYSK